MKRVLLTLFASALVTLASAADAPPTPDPAPDSDTVTNSDAVTDDDANTVPKRAGLCV